MTNARIDHILYAAPNLPEAIGKIEALTGMTPIHGGAHPGHGTVNAILPFKDGVYLEIIAPDPSQQAHMSEIATLIMALPEPRLVTFAVAGTRLEDLPARASKAGLDMGPINAEQRVKPDGSLLRWRLRHLAPHQFGLSLPFFIDWGETEHPSQIAPTEIEMKSFTAMHPQAQDLSTAYQAFGIPVLVKNSADLGFELSLMTPKGQIILI